MRFDRPDLLYLLLLAAPVVVLHMVRRRWRRRPVPSLLLWEKTLSSLPRRPSLGVLASLLSLLLVLLAIVAGSLSAATPVIGTPGPEAKHLVIAVAASARMQGERWRSAVALASSEITRKAAADPVTLVLVSERPRVLAAREPDGGAAIARLRAERPTLAAADWGLAAPLLARAAAEGARVVAIGVRPEAPPGVSIHPVAGRNEGITDFGVRVRRTEVEVFLRTAGEGTGEVAVTLRGAEVARVPVAEEVALTVARGRGGLLRASIEPDAGPEFDAAAEAWIPPPAAPRVGLVAEEGPRPFLRAALEVAGALLVSERFDVLIVAGSRAPARLPQGNVVLLTPPPEAIGLAALPPAEATPVWRQAEDHPVVRGLDTAEVLALGAVPARLPEGAVPLLSLPGGAVAAAGEFEGTRWVWIGLDSGNSTLPSTAAYPLILRNALAWLAALDTGPLPPSFALDRPLRPRVPLPPGVRAVAIEGPGPDARDVVEVVDGRFSFRPADPVEGEVRVTIGDDVHRTRANAVLPGETAAEPLPGLPALGPDRSGLEDEERRLWWLFAAAAGVFLLAESLVRLLTRRS